MERAPNAWDRFYHHHEAPWRGERPLQDLPLEGRVLELGCGNGKLLRPLQAAGADAVGLDISFNILSRLGQGVLADAAVLPFRDATFQTVLDIHCTGHLLAEGRAAAASEKRRVLAPGGVLVVERLMPDDLRAGQGTEVEPGTRQVQDGRTTHFSDLESLAAEHPGFAVVDHVEQRRTTRYHGKTVTRASLRAVLR